MTFLFFGASWPYISNLNSLWLVPKSEPNAIGLSGSAFFMISMILMGPSDRHLYIRGSGLMPVGSPDKSMTSGSGKLEISFFSAKFGLGIFQYCNS